MFYVFCKLALSAKALNASSAFEPVRPQISQQITSFSENLFFPLCLFLCLSLTLSLSSGLTITTGRFSFWSLSLMQQCVCFCAPSDTSQGVISVVCISEWVLGGEIEDGWQTTGKWAVCSKKSTSPILAQPWGNPELFKVCVVAARVWGGKQVEEWGLLEIMAVH